MTRGLAAMLAAVILLNASLPAARAQAQAAGPFPEVPLPKPVVRPHRWAYASIVAGLGLAGASFALERLRQVVVGPREPVAVAVCPQSTPEGASPVHVSSTAGNLGHRLPIPEPP